LKKRSPPDDSGGLLLRTGVGLLDDRLDDLLDDLLDVFSGRALFALNQVELDYRRSVLLVRSGATINTRRSTPENEKGGSL
jgi:hypothetical protein